MMLQDWLRKNKDLFIYLCIYLMHQYIGAILTISHQCISAAFSFFRQLAQLAFIRQFIGASKHLSQIH